MSKAIYLGRPCNFGHVEATGGTYRYESNYKCVECFNAYRASDAYKEYQAKYHQMMRAKHPEKLNEYRKTQVAKGNSWPKYYKKKEQPK